MITKLALCNNKKNKTRSILIMLAVFLTTVLLSAIATFGYGIIKYEKVNAENFYGAYYGTFGMVNQEQIREMEKRSEFDRIGKAASAGEVEDERNISLLWVDKETIDLSNLSQQMEEGNFPKKANEIAGQKEMFECLGVKDAKVGDTVVLNFRRNKTEAYTKQEFVISGILKPMAVEQENQGYAGYISKAWFESLYPEEERVYTAYVTLNDSVDVDSYILEDTLKDLAKKCDIDPKYVQDNFSYAMFALDPGTETIVGCVMVALLVILFSVLVIYNIFQVGIVQKIQEYGKIKALGTTKKQMKKLVFREGMLVAIPAVPIGMVAGAGITILFLNQWFEESEKVLGRTDVILVSMISVPLLLLCGGVSLLTVWVALKRPMSIVSKISPMEAIRFQEKKGKNKGIRKGKKQMSVQGLTMSNLAMNKKRTITTIVTMGLSCVLFVVIANFTGNVSTTYDARKNVPYGQFQIDLTYDTNDTAYPENNLDAILKENPLDESLVKEIKALDGVTEVKTMDLLYMKDKNNTLQSIGVMDKEQFENEVHQGSLKGKVDYEEASEENAIIYGYSYFLEDTGYEIGDTMSMKIEDADQQIPYKGKLMGAFGSTNAGNWVITDQTYKNLGFKGKNTGTIWVDCDKKDCAKVEAGLRELLAGKNHCELSSYEGALQTSETSLGMMETLCYAFLFLVGLIAFMNMANTMVISITTRKRELGVLQALGMTNRQLNKMLRNEGLLFTVGSIIISLIVGMPIGYGLFLYGRNHGFFGLDVYHIPVKEIAAMIVILAVLQISLSFILSRNIKKESLVERIRYQE